jgi:hypothetical protein
MRHFYFFQKYAKLHNINFQNEAKERIFSGAICGEISPNLVTLHSQFSVASAHKNILMTLLEYFSLPRCDSQ